MGECVHRARLSIGKRRPSFWRSFAARFRNKRHRKKRRRIPSEGAAMTRLRHARGLAPLAVSRLLRKAGEMGRPLLSSRDRFIDWSNVQIRSKDIQFRLFLKGICYN